MIEGNDFINYLKGTKTKYAIYITQMMQDETKGKHQIIFETMFLSKDTERMVA